MWKIGPEWAAQQQKKVAASTRNCGVRKASDAVIVGVTVEAEVSAEAWCTPAAGARRTKKEAGISSAQATIPMLIIGKRQSWVEMSQRANGEMVIGATPTPTDT